MSGVHVPTVLKVVRRRKRRKKKKDQRSKVEKVMTFLYKHADHDQSTHGNWADGRPLYHITDSAYWMPEERAGGTIFVSDEENLQAWIDRVDWGGNRDWVVELQILPAYRGRYQDFFDYEIGGLREAQVAWDHVEIIGVHPKSSFISKHMGPGDHPSGTGQDVHGRGRQRSHTNAAEHAFAQERIGALRDEIDALRTQRDELVHAPDMDIDEYNDLNQQIIEAERRQQDFITRSTSGASSDDLPRHGIHRFTGSLTQPEVEAVGRRLAAIDRSRRRLIDEMETQRHAHANSMEIDQDLYDIEDQIKALDIEEGELLIALTTPTLPGLKPSAPERPPIIDKEARSYSSKNPKVGTIHDPMPVADGGGDGEELARNIFEAQLEIDGDIYDVQVEDYEERSGWQRVRGKIYQDGRQVGYFNRSFPDEVTVHNDEFYIEAPYQGKGIGTMLLSHWEGELAEAGVQLMKVTAADIGRYAWAVSGYEWDYPNSDIVDDLVFRVQQRNEEVGLDPMDYSTNTDPDPEWNRAREMVYNYDEYGEPPQPWEIAMLGAGTDNHFGKEVMMSDGMWDGYKHIGD